MHENLMDTRTVIFDLDDVQVARTENVNGVLWELTYSLGAGEDVLAQARACMPSRGEYLEVIVEDSVNYIRFLEVTR
ncbi:hypothetical protein AB0C28_49120 [Nonomuraea sp. NPDC048892]|uniref:hypothetical protein n=1 Tax=Nonomuraea sp. NPDC048892 TaxID=3154624 RepID=UPI0033DFE3B5